MPLESRNNNLFYGPNHRWRVYGKYGSLTTTFKKRYRAGTVTELPTDYLYNSLTNRFLLKTRKALKKHKNMNIIGNVISPPSIFDYDVSKINSKTLVITPMGDNSGKRNMVVNNVTGFNNWLGSIEFMNESNVIQQSQTVLDQIKSVISKSIPKFQSIVVANQPTMIKYNLVLEVVFNKVGGEQSTFNVKTKAKNVSSKHDVLDVIKNVDPSTLYNEINAVQGKGSGWSYLRIKSFKLNYTKYKPLRGSSYIDLPINIKNSKSCINPKNTNDNECFKWCLAIHNALKQGDKKNLERISKLKKYIPKELPLNVKYPFEVTSRNIEKIQKCLKYSINIYGYEKNIIVPLFVSQTQGTDNVNLLLIQGDTTSHFVYIKKFNGLMAKQYKNNTRYFCHYCLHGYAKKDTLTKHIANGCASFGAIKTVMPEKDNNIMKFKNQKKEYMKEFVIYADFESTLNKVDDNSGKKTQVKNIHRTCGFCMYAVCVVDSSIQFEPILYTATTEEEQANIFNVFYNELNQLGKQIHTLFQRKQSISQMTMTSQDKTNHKNATTCYLCSRDISGSDKVRDHCHVSGKYRGCACTKCNVNYNNKHSKIPIFFHNLKGYDSHFIIKNLKKEHHSYVNKKGEVKTSKIDVVANNEEKYITFSFGSFQFLDSYAFLSSSLDKLAALLPQGAFKHTTKRTKTHMLKHAKRKGVFPYEYLENISVMAEKQLPSIDKFYSHLSEKGITEDDYKHAHSVWRSGKMKTIKDYHDFYLLTDVLLLTDVFEHFREQSMNNYGLDPAHYWTLPGFSWDCMLKMTQVELELLTDIDMYQFCEKGIRGGVSLITQRYAKANNKYIPKTYDSSKPSSYIMYVDANNLYGSSMSGMLPYKNFQWVEDFNISDLEKDEETGYILEVDLTYPKELHDLHNCLPVAPENIRINDEQLSKWQKESKKLLNIKTAKVTKLVPNLNNKEKYILHSKNLKYYIELGLELTKIHRVLKFNQKRWLKPYIDFNTVKRAEAVSKGDSFGKSFYKLMNNAVFGKTMENQRNRIDYELCDSKERIVKLTSDPRYNKFTIIANDLVGVSRSQTKVVLNKPVYAGLTILDNSKLNMYDFHYSYIKEKYGDKAKLLFTDTDSLCYHIETDDVYRDFKKASKQRFDFSNYDKGSYMYDKTNQSQLGIEKGTHFQSFFKDETPNQHIEEFCGVRSKAYSCLLSCGKEKKTLKGVKKAAQMRIRHKNYYDCLFSDDIKDKSQSITFQSIRSYKHEVRTIEITKTSLSCYDDKRYIYDGINSYSYGHKSIVKSK